MKVFTEIRELIGKKPFKDSRLKLLEERFIPLKTTYYSFDFNSDNPSAADCLLVSKDDALGLIVEDIEKAEKLIAGTGTNEVINDQKVPVPLADIFKAALDILNNEKLIRDCLPPENEAVIRNYGFLTARPVVIYNGQEFDQLCAEILVKANRIFFFTAGKKEVRAWIVDEGENVVAAAGKIHSDLARGFIRAEVYNLKDLDQFHNLNEAKSRGLLQLVDKTYTVKDGDVLDIKFNV